MPIDEHLLALARAASEAQRHLRFEWFERGGYGQPDADDYYALARFYRSRWEEFYAAVGTIPRGIQRAEPEEIERGLVYLESAPRCQQSGYFAEEIMRRLSQQTMDDSQRRRIRSIVIAELWRPQTRGARHIGALVGSIWDADLERTLGAVIDRGYGTTRRAKVVWTAAMTWRRSRGLSTEELPAGPTAIERMREEYGI